MKKYQVGIEFTPNGDTKSTKGLISGRDIQDVRHKVKLNKSRNTYLHVIYDENKRIIEIWKLNKQEYDKLQCGFGLNDYAEVFKSMGLI